MITIRRDGLFWWYYEVIIAGKFFIAGYRFTKKGARNEAERLLRESRTGRIDL